MRFVRSSVSEKPARLGILPGGFNPPTRAHMELVVASRAHVDEVVCVVPAKLPHKEFFGATLDERVDMLKEADPAGMHAIAVSEQGLFLDIARELREHYGPAPELYFLCGADAAERIVNWDYGRPGAIERMLEEFQLLVAPRGGYYQPPGHLSHRVHSLAIGDGYHAVSSSEVRDRIRSGERWEHLVPPGIVPVVRKIYSAEVASRNVRNR